MKATGVVRKIDSLGRIVIPKEIRKNLKIRDGESLEIFVEGESIFLKKFSSLSGISEFAQDFIDVLNLLTSKDVLITDMNKVLSTSKNLKEKYANSELSSNYLNILEKREVYVSVSPAKLEVADDKELDGYYLFVPLVISGELLGSIVMFSKNEDISEKDKILLKFVIKFLEKNLDE